MRYTLLCGKCNSKFEKEICDSCWEKLLEDAKRAGHNIELVETVDSGNILEKQNGEHRA